MKSVVVCENPNLLKGEISFEERERQLKMAEESEKKRKNKEKMSPYKEFAQLNMAGNINEIAMYKLTESPAAGKLFWFIANHMDGFNALIASYTVFHEALGISNPTIARGIRFLRENGLLYVKKSGPTNVYMLNPDIIWKSWGNNKKYCEFPANIIISESEQDTKPHRAVTEQIHRVMNVKSKT